MSITRGIPPAELLNAVQALYERGQVIDTLALAQSFRPLREWGGTTACAWAARIAANVGAPQLATHLSVRAWRTDRSDPVSQLQFGLEVLTRRGPLAFWLAQREWPAQREATVAQQSEFLALKACALAGLRDFSLAEKLIAQVEELGARQPWAHLQRAHVLEGQDRIEEALAAAAAAGALHPHPFYRPTVQVQARLLQLLDRDSDAIQLLADAGSFLQNGPISVQLFSILAENGRWQEAKLALDRYVALSPLLAPPLIRWVASQRARVAYHLGERSEAARLAAPLEDEFHRSFVSKLSAAPEAPERVHLDVTFVRQHFKTCAPATLAALGRFWKMPSDHLKLAEAMCYDGTPSWSQREWAEKNGWIVREFRVTHEGAVSLLARGIPFAVSTVQATSAHMQAVAGFDATRGTLLLRDPGQPYIVEVAANDFFERQRPFGPHGMVFLPSAECLRLDRLALVDGEVYEDLHFLRLALARHDRVRAAEMLSRMEVAFADHALVWEARLDLATYDANNSEKLRCLDKLLELFPNHPARLLRRLGSMHEASAEERIQFLRTACSVRGADPALFVELARALLGDARRLPEARRSLRRASRRRPMDSTAISVQADLCWEDQSLETATELYRFAANMEGFREALYQSWFIACRRTRRTDEAMSHLRDRFARFGRQSGQPALTLAWAWRQLGQPGQARQVLAEATRLRPDDAQLRLRSAAIVSLLGETEQAKSLLDSARGKVRENDWLRAAAEIAESRRNAKDALQYSREILRTEPLALDVHARVARMLTQLEGNASALAHLRAACSQFPQHYMLRRTSVEWSRHAGPAEVESAVRGLLRVDPADAWARRELASALAHLNRNDEALLEATEAVRIQPRHTFGFSILGFIHRQLRQIPEARAQFRRAVELSADNTIAIKSLIELASVDQERRDELAFIESELIRQVVQGDGLLAFLEAARPLLEPEKLLQRLYEAHSLRPDLWHAWAALVSQLGHIGNFPEALDVARQATEKFPHLPKTWLDLALVHQWRKEVDAEIDAATRAFEMNPAWVRAALLLAAALERCGRMEEARRIYERALQQSADDAQLHSVHAHLLWRLRQPEAALAEIEKALRLAPGFDWAWGLLTRWAADCRQPQRALQFSRALVDEFPGDARAWLALARVLSAPAQASERLTAVERALKLNSRSTTAWDFKAETLALSQRFDEAIQSCEEGAAVCESDPFMLKGRRAWIEAQRHQVVEAVRLMRLVLKENVNYAWGWNQLAHWLISQGATADAAAVLEQLLRLRPRDVWVHQQLGALRLQQKDHAGAQKAFETALQLAPTDAVAARNILDLQLKASDLEGATATVSLMEIHQPGAGALACNIFLLLQKKQRSVALQAFEKLCASPDPDSWPINAVAQAFHRARQAPQALRTLQRALKLPSCNPQAGLAAVELMLDNKRYFAATRLFMTLKSGEGQTRAAPRLVQALAKSKRKLLFRWLFWRRREALRLDDASWAQVGYALTIFSQMSAAALWLSDWRNRQDVQPWTCFNLCLALRHLGRCDEANEISRHVLEKWGHCEGSADMRLFLAVEQALAGNVSDAAELLRHLVVRKNVAYDHDLRALADALVEFLELPESQRSETFKGIRRKLGQRFTSKRMLRVTKDVRRTFGRAGACFVLQGGGWRARLWFAWMLNWQWLLIPILPLLVLVAIFPPVLFGLLVGLLIRSKRRPKK